tara:strand:- start:10113 stop:10988 length:876 start_codon:yes stop_codon:yes gene_type:complete
MRNIKLITNCERPPNYLMDISVKHWLKNGFEPKDLIFLVNNISHFDMVKSLKESYNIDAKRVESIDDIYDDNQCVVWDDLVEYDYGAYHDREHSIINKIQHKLLQEGVDVVIFLDRDELLWHDSGDLRKVLDTFSEPIIRPRGIEVIQSGDEEDFDLNKPIAEQRSWFRWFPSKSKACITRIPVDWIIGRHGTKCGRWPHADTHYHPELQNHPESDVTEYPGLYLVHFDKMDMNMLYNLRLESQKIFKTNNRHTGVVDEQSFTEWFTEAHRDTLPGRELYQDKEFLYKVGV